MISLVGDLERPLNPRRGKATAARWASSRDAGAVDQWTYHDLMRWVLSLQLVVGSSLAALMGVLLWPGDNPVPTGVWVPAYAASIPVLGAGLIVMRAARRGVRRTVPWPKAAVIAVATAYALATVTLLVLTLATTSTPISREPPFQTADGRYAVGSDGDLIYLTRSEFVHLVEVGQRGFAAVGSIFCLAGILLAVGSLGGAERVRRTDRPMARAAVRRQDPSRRVPPPDVADRLARPMRPPAPPADP